MQIQEMNRNPPTEPESEARLVETQKQRNQLIFFIDEQHLLHTVLKLKFNIKHSFVITSELQYIDKYN